MVRARTLLTLALLAVVALAALGGAGAAARKGKPVKLTGKTVVVDQKTVRKQLIGISKDGKTFKFRKATGALRKLKQGKVMLLKGRDVELVTKVRHKGRQLLVTTKPPKITDVVKSGKITFTGKPDVRKAFLARVVPFTGKASARAATTFRPPSWPYVGSGEARAASALDGGFSTQGSQGPFGYSLSFSPASKTRMDISGVICFQWGSICSNGPSNGTSVEVNVSGYIDAGQEDVGLTVNGGSVTHSSLSVKNLVGHAHIQYKVAHGEGGPTDNPPVFHVPIGVDYSIPGPYGVPLYFKLQTALLIDLGFDTKNGTMHGGSDVTFGGSDTIESNGKKITTAQKGTQAKITILPGGQFTTVTSGGIIRVQFPKIGAGLGITAANGYGYLDMVTSMGQTTSSAINPLGFNCSAYVQNFNLGAGVEAQLGPFAIASPKKTIFDKTVKLDEPGCSTS